MSLSSLRRSCFCALSELLELRAEPSTPAAHHCSGACPIMIMWHVAASDQDRGRGAGPSPLADLRQACQSGGCMVVLGSVDGGPWCTHNLVAQLCCMHICAQRQHRLVLRNT